MILPLVRRSGVASLHINVVSFGYVLWPSFSTTKGLIRKTLFLNHHYNGDFHGTQKGYLWCNIIFRGVGWRRKRWWLVICSERFVLTFSNVNVFQDLRSCGFLSCTVVKSPVCYTETFSKNIFNIVQIKCVLSSHSKNTFVIWRLRKRALDIQTTFVIDLSFPKLLVFKVHSRTFFVSGDFVGRFGVVNRPSNVSNWHCS